MKRLLVVAAFLAACGPTPVGKPDAGGVPPAADAAPLPPDATPLPPDASRPDAAVCTSGILCGAPVECCPVGTECYLGACEDVCASGVRCGGDGLTCCSAGDVCLDQACQTPGDACADSFDCPDAWFCEPTLGRCLPQPSGPLCEVRPTSVTFQPTEEWHWTGYSQDAKIANVVVAPAVADIDVDGVPDVVFGAYATGAAGTVMLLAVRGTDGAEELAVPTATLSLREFSGVAVGNLDDDPELEIVSLTPTGLGRVEADGTVKWQITTGSLKTANDGYPALANMDADPHPEIVVGAMIIDRDGNMKLDKGWIGCNHGWCMSAVADIDHDGEPDIVGGNQVLHADGSPLWTAPASVGDGFPAVADMNGDGQADVVNVSEGEVFVLDGSDGSILFGPVPIPGGGHGGPPTVADFDGDGRPELATAGLGQYTVYDLDCTLTGDPGFCPSAHTDGVLWTTTTHDQSSSITGSSVFDFEGDGAAEVIYNDECHLFIYRGVDGTRLLELPNTSRTAVEYPIVVDVDADGNSEFVVPANNDEIARDGCDAPGQQGLRAYGDATDKWVRTRPVWNEHAYHVTNVTPSGGVPAVEVDNWTVTGLNDYRQNVQGEGIFNAPDLTVGVSVDCSQYPTIGIVAEVQNRGSLGVPAGVAVAFFRDGGLLGVARTTRALLPGSNEAVAWPYAAPAGDIGPFDFSAAVDSDDAGSGHVSECEEANNQADIAEVACIVL